MKLVVLHGHKIKYFLYFPVFVCVCVCFCWLPPNCVCVSDIPQSLGEQQQQGSQGSLCFPRSHSTQKPCAVLLSCLTGNTPDVNISSWKQGLELNSSFSSGHYLNTWELRAGLRWILENGLTRDKKLISKKTGASPQAGLSSNKQPLTERW